MRGGNSWIFTSGLHNSLVFLIEHSPSSRQSLTIAMAWHSSLCEELRGIARDDVRPGLRILGFRKRVTIAFAVHDRRVEVLGLYYGGQRVEELISDQTD